MLCKKQSRGESSKGRIEIALQIGAAKKRSPRKDSDEEKTFQARKTGTEQSPPLLHESQEGVVIGERVEDRGVGDHTIRDQHGCMQGEKGRQGQHMYTRTCMHTHIHTLC